MTKKFELILSYLLLGGGLWYFGLVFAWNQYGLERAYFPAIALTNIMMGLINLARVRDQQPTIVKLALPLNIIITGYALYIGYLCAVAGILTAPPIIDMSWMVIITCFSAVHYIRQPHSNTDPEALPAS